MKVKTLALGLLGAIALTSCGGNNTKVEAQPVEELINTLRKGYTVSGELIKTNRFYTNDNYDVINSNLGTKIDKYAFEYTYQNSSEYTGVDRNLYLMDGNTPRMIIDDNVFEKDNAVHLNALTYENKIAQFEATNSQDDSGLNELPYGVAGLINPFLNLSAEEITQVGANAFSMDNDKASSMVLDMFVTVDQDALASAVNRNIFSLDENGKGIDRMFIYLDEYKTILTDGDKYTNIYCGQTYTISLTFTDEGVANAKDKLKPYATKAENAPLRTIFDKMNGQNLKTTRRDVTFYDGIEYTEGYETIINYFDMANKKILYQVYDAARQQAPEMVTASDFLLLENEKGLMYPWGRDTEGKWAKAPQFNRIGGFEFNEYLPVIGAINENIFTLDKATNIYHCPEYLAAYFPIDGCLIPTMVVSSAIYQGFTNDIQIKLKQNGDIDYVRVCCYFDAGSFIQSGYYEMRYEYGPNVILPFGIDGELEAQNITGKGGK